MRSFSSYGPTDARFNYEAPRRDLIERCVEQLIGPPDEGGRYFTIWAPRQTGKTWLMRRAIQEIRARCGDRFAIGALSMQGRIRDDDGDDAFFRAVPGMFRDGFDLDPEAPASWAAWLRLFARKGGLFDKPLILLIDEFDSLPPPILAQIVAGFREIYLARERYNLHALALIGVRAVLGLDSPRGSPFNVQRSLKVKNLTRDEVIEMFAQYQAESGQSIDPEVVETLYASTRGQPGLVGWFGELLTEKYNPNPREPITMKQWQRVYMYACFVEPNNTVINLIQKAKGAYRDHVLSLYTQPNMPFSFDDEACNYLYMNGVMDTQEGVDEQGMPEVVCRFSSPFIQLRLYNALTNEMFDRRRPVLALEPLDRLTEVFAGEHIDAAALLQRYKAYLGRLAVKGLDPWKAQPRRADLHLTEAVGHFHLYAWLKDALGRACVVSPEFPTGNGKVDLCLSTRDKRGIIEVKSFTSQLALDEGKVQTARYAKKLGLAEAALCVFVPVSDEAVLSELSSVEVVEGVTVSTVAIGWG